MTESAFKKISLSMTIFPPQHNVIVDKTFQFTVNILKFPQTLQVQQHFALLYQFLKSVTSIGANIKEAQNAESKLILHIDLKL